MRDDQRKNLPDSSAVFPSASGGHEAPPSTARHPLDDEAKRLCCMISDLRLRIAEKRGVPAYMIFNDAALRAMCALRPRTKEEFLEVPGVGEAKLRAYGDDFLQAIAQWEKIQER